MKHTPNDTSKRMLEKPDPITSSARDPIDRWLDVFVRLLRVPKQDAQRIRDELEDHLRARVDDLMVTGQSEPEAVRLAVAELGETAELARQFQTAAKPHRRRTMLAASTLVSAGLMVSAVMLTQQAVPPSTVQNAGASEESPRDAAAVQSETKRVDLDTILFAEDLVARQGEELVRLEDAIALIRATAPQDVIVNYAGITGPQVPGETHYLRVSGLSLKGLPLETGVTYIGGAISGANTGLVLQPLGDKLELASQMFFDHRDATLVEYDLSGVLSPPDGPAIKPLEFQNTVTSLIQPSAWGSIARVGMVSQTMLIHAPPRIHSQIKDLLERIDARYEAHRDAERAERRAKLEQQVLDFAAEIVGYETRIVEIEAELERVRTERRAARERYFEIDVRSAEADQDQLVKLKVQQAEAQDMLSLTESQLYDLELRLSNMKQSLAVTKGQLRSAEKSLQELDKAARPVPATDPDATSSAIYITGNILRPSTYHKRDGLTLRRAIAQAGGQHRDDR